MKRILLMHTLSYTAGIAAGFLLGVPPAVPLAAALLILIFSLWMLWKRGIFYYLVLFSFLVGMGWGQAADRNAAFFPVDSEKTVRLFGMVDGRPLPAGDGQSFPLEMIRLNGKDYPGGGRVQVLAAKTPQLSYGDLIQVEGKVLPDLTATNPHQFDYAAYQRRQGIVATVGTLYGGEIKTSGINRGRIFFRLVYSLRERMDQVLTDLPARQKSFIDGMLFGDKGTLSFEERSVLSETGLMDAFAVSGMHMGFVVLLAGNIARLTRLGRWGSFIFISGLVFFYAAITGFTASVLRSGLMAVTGLAAYTLGSRKDLPTAFAAAALVILIKSPQSLFDAGFQLSFVAAWGVLFLTPVLTECLPAASVSFGGHWREACAALIAAQLALAPLIAYYFNVLSAVGLIVGPLVAWPVGFVIFLGLLALILCPFSLALAVLPLYGAGLITEIIWRGADSIARIPGSHFILPTPSLLSLFFYYGCLALLPFSEKLKIGRRRPLCLAGVLVVILLLPVGYDHRLTVTFLDVGQGDSVFIQSPAGHRVLIDGGGKPLSTSSGPGERIVLPYLKSQGVSRLDLVINTHPHDDHIQGLKTVLQEMTVGGLMIGKKFSRHPGSIELISLASQRQIPVYLVAEGTNISLAGGGQMEVLYPGEDPDRQADPEVGEENNGSLIIKLSYQDVSFLFTGDAEAEAFQALEKEAIDLDADILKIPHHGSRNGFLPAFYQAVSPVMVVIPVGRNSFGHPSKEVTDYWQRMGIPLYRTDRDGAVTVKTDGEKIYVQTVKGAVP